MSYTHRNNYHSKHNYKSTPKKETYLSEEELKEKERRANTPAVYMDENSLNNELKNLKKYVEYVRKDVLPSNDWFKKRIASFVITGMIEKINILISTGAYDNADKRLLSFFEQVSIARTEALHNKKSSNLDVMLKHALKISSFNYDTSKTALASNIKNHLKAETYPYLKISRTINMDIEYDLDMENDCYRLTNMNTKERVYIPKGDIVILDNSLNGSINFLVKLSDEKNCYYKKDDHTRTIKVSSNQLDLTNFFLPAIKNKRATVDLDKKINSIIAAMIKKGPFNKYDLLAKDDHGNEINFEVYKVLQEYLYNHVIDESIAFKKPSVIINNPTLASYSNISIDYPTLDENTIIKIAKKLSLKDLYYMELFLKETKGYKDRRNKIRVNNESLDNIETKDIPMEIIEAKASALLDIFKSGPQRFCDVLTSNDRGLNTLYHTYRTIRNNLAHNPLTDEGKRILTTKLEVSTILMAKVCDVIYKSYMDYKNKKDPFISLHGVKEEDDYYSLTNKTQEYRAYKHTRETLVIGQNKYLQLIQKNGPDNLFIQVDGVMYSYDYRYGNDLYSLTCIANKNAHIVQIDKNRSVSTYKGPIDYASNHVFNHDPYDDCLFQAYNYLKTYKQSSIDFNDVTCSPLIVIYNLDMPIYADSLKDMINRKFTQYAIPRELLSACTCKFPKNHDDPLLILDDENNVVAKIFYGFIKDSNTITQVKENKEEIILDSIKVLPKEADATSITRDVKWEDINHYEKRN